MRGFLRHSISLWTARARYAAFILLLDFGCTRDVFRTRWIRLAFARMRGSARVASCARTSAARGSLRALRARRARVRLRVLRAAACVLRWRLRLRQRARRALLLLVCARCSFLAFCARSLRRAMRIHLFVHSAWLLPFIFSWFVFALIGAQHGWRGTLSTAARFDITSLRLLAHLGLLNSALRASYGDATSRSRARALTLPPHRLHLLPLAWDIALARAPAAWRAAALSSGFSLAARRFLSLSLCRVGHAHGWF